MSASNRPEDLDEPSRYAPKWIREGQAKSQLPAERRPAGAPQLVILDNAALPPDEPQREDSPRWRNDTPFEGDRAIKRMRMQRSLEPELVAEPEWSEPPRFPLGMIVRAAAAIGIATVGALVYVGELPLPFARATQEAAARETTTTETDLRLPAPREQARPPKAADRVGDLRMVPSPPQPDPQPATAGAAVPARAEEAPPAERPVNPVALASTVAWPAAPAASAAVAPIPRQLDPEEINTLIRRGEEFIAQGDIAAARLMLKRAAEAGNSRAALALGATYDPDMLRKMGVLGFQPDAAQAREWYEKAASLGSGEASQRLAVLPR
jgi:hypothetical protein